MCTTIAEFSAAAKAAYTPENLRRASERVFMTAAGWCDPYHADPPKARHTWHWYAAPQTDVRSACGRWAYTEGTDMALSLLPATARACKTCLHLSVVRNPMGVFFGCGRDLWNSKRVRIKVGTK